MAWVVMARWLRRQPIRERLDRRGCRLELAGLEPRDDLARELVGLVLLLGLEDRVHRGRDAAVEDDLDVDRVELAARDVRVVGNADANERLAAVREPRRALDSVAAEAHGLCLYPRRAASNGRLCSRRARAVRPLSGTHRLHRPGDRPLRRRRARGPLDLAPRAHVDL